MTLSTLKAAVIRKASLTALVIKKHSPEILLTAGVVGMVGATVVACKASTKAGKLLDDAKAKLDIIKEASEKFPEEEYSATDRQVDTVTAYVQTGFEFVKLYGPAVTLGALSIGCVVASYGIMKKRNLAYAAAYKVLEEGFTKYRGRVIEQYGEEKDLELRYGAERRVTTETVVNPETGKKEKITKEEFIPARDCGPYTRFFDEFNDFWDNSSEELNFMFLTSNQDYANNLLHRNGYVFLNDVYKMLGFKPVPDGQLMGWFDTPKRDKVISFGIFEGKTGASRRFVNRTEPSILLDFNVDPLPIYDQI